MKKICLVVVGIYIGILGAFSQTVDTTAYKNRKLKLEEINLVSSYYTQNGNNSSVLGGSGSEKLNDFSNVLDVKFTKYDKHNRKHGFTVDVGIDHYSSASSDQVDLKANSSASSADTRIYPSLSWNVENEKTGKTVGLNISTSTEYDYKSVGFGANFSQKSKDKNREFGVRAQVYLDKVLMILPIELRTGGRPPARARNSYSASFSLAQVINKRLQVLFIADIVKQDGFLSLPFHRVKFTNGNVRSELLPSSRLKIPVGARLNYFLGDKIILRSFYRFYYDDWGLISNSIDVEASYKLTPFFSITPFYRFYQQSGVDYFAAINQHKTTEQYYTSNYDLSKFYSNFFGAGFRYAPAKGVLGIRHFHKVEVRYGHYSRSTGLNSDIISLNLGIK
ncbi:MAG: DUF3570 domain-containing protein [Ferruginibacter sp.]|nr:DUF3570 domain-containing protein [Ferruginibacter sp.]